MTKTGKTNKQKRLVLIDAHALIHRAYHALPDFVSSTGEPTGALYGLSSMLIKMIGELEPDYLVAAYDLPEPTDRHKAFDEYKAGREKADEELVHQINHSRDVFEAFAIPIYDKPGFEADDVIGTISEKLKKQKGLEVVIASGDLDTLQLVDKKRVRVYTLRKGLSDTVMYDESAVQERFGFGPEYLPDYKGLRGDPSDNIPGVKGVGEKTATTLIKEFGHLEDIYKGLEKDEEKVADALSPRVVKLLREGKDEAEFSKELAEIRTDADIAFSLPKKEWNDTFDISVVLKLFRELGFKSLAERVKQNLGDGENDSADKDDELQNEEVDERALQETGIALWLLDSTKTNPSLEDILRYARVGSFKEAKEYIFSELTKQGLVSVYEKIEKPLIPIIEKMQERGVKVNTGYLKGLSSDYHKKLSSIEKQIYKHAGGEFNINSPKQLAHILFDTLGLSGKGKTATGRRSTRESELQKLKGEHEIIGDILDYRELQKLLSTYIDTLPRLVSPKDGRLHASFIQTGTTTGRMASQSPNLQNIPIRTELGKVIRNAFVAEEGFALAALDYSQIELRVSAALSGDTKMIKIFKQGGDIHTEVAKEVFGSADSDARRKAKVINFGIHYGMGSVALSHQLGTTRKEAKEFLDEYFERFSGLTEHIEKTKRQAKKKGYTETMFGRRRYFPGFSSHLPYVKAEAERMAINAPIQGTSADIIKLAMHQIDEWIEKERLRDDVYLVLQIHDELVYEIQKKRAEDIAREIRNIMESVVSPKELGGVPLVADAAIGPNWGSLTPLERR